MFTAENVLERVREQPFRPLRVVTTTGQTYDIYHPDQIFVARSFLMVGIPSTRTSGVSDLITRVSLINVAEIQDLPTPVAAGNN